MHSQVFDILCHCKWYYYWLKVLLQVIQVLGVLNRVGKNARTKRWENEARKAQTYGSKSTFHRERVGSSQRLKGTAYRMFWGLSSLYRCLIGYLVPLCVIGVAHDQSEWLGPIRGWNEATRLHPCVRKKGKAVTGLIGHPLSVSHLQHSGGGGGRCKGSRLWNFCDLGGKGGVFLLIQFQEVRANQP